MKVVIDIPEDRYADIQRIASVQLERRWPTLEQIISKGVIIIEPQKWIPAAERLPEIPKGCDVYWCSECGDVSADEYIVMIKGATLPTALFWDGKHWFDINGEQTLFPVIAWMQFPEAYKEDNNA